MDFQKEGASKKILYQDLQSINNLSSGRRKVKYFQKKYLIFIAIVVLYVKNNTKQHFSQQKNERIVIVSYTTLGLDLGVASIGWALIAEDSDKFKLEAWGSRIFEQGLDTGKGGLDAISAGKGTSRCAARRLKKALRRQYRRRRERKDDVKRVLTDNGMLPNPLMPDFFVEMDRKLVQTLPEPEREHASHIAPYLYRKLALDRPLAKEEFGRAIYHLAQRRGYLSNRKQELKDKDSGVVKESIKGLRNAIEQAGARTLAEYFCTVNPNEERIRARYTDRAMYVDEFRKICEAQRELVSPELEEKLFHAIFFQRKLKSSKGLIGKCQLHPEHRRCTMACEEAQLFRILTTVANLRVENKRLNTIRELSEAEHDTAVAFLNEYSEDFTQRGTVTLDKLGKKLGLAKGEKFTLGDESKDIYGNELHVALVRVFGAEKAAAMPPDEQKKFFHDLDSIEKESTLEKRLRQYWKLDTLQTETAMKVMLPDSYCAFSIQALREILPDLEAKIPLSTILKNTRASTGTVCDSFDLLPVFDSPECSIELRNPLVHRVMTELRTVVNSIVKRFGKPNAIRIELARDLKTTTKQKENITRLNLQKEKERKEIAERILKEVGIERPSRNDILKVMLADECNFECPYTGKHFSMQDLLYGKDIHIEHIIPYSRSYDDSFRNKTLCEASANSAKNNRTPFEAFSGEEYQRILARVAQFKGPYAAYKLDLFKREKIDEEDFMSRNLNDTRYASRIAMQYLGLLYGGMVDKNGKQRIFATSGGATALIRRAWGGNYLLGEGEKVRTDHRHHAIDAVTIALTTPDLVQKIAATPPEKRRRLHESQTLLVDPELFSEANRRLDFAAVSHHVVNKMRGALHEETVYGKDYGDSERHVRVDLASCTPDDIAAIVDPAIQEIVLEKLGRSSSEEVTKDDLKIFHEAANLPVLCDAGGNPVNTIKKVRVRQNLKTITIGSGDGIRNVKTGSNYVLAIFAKRNEKGEETEWVGEIVTLFDALHRKKRNLPIFEKNRPGLEFKFSLKKGDIVKWTRDREEYLCIVRGISLPQFSLVPVRDARDQKSIKAAKLWFTPTLSAAFKGKMQKFRMNIFGELQRAND